jgi:multisubunit Na+/H+ antiporter MnhB subunit
MDVISPIFYGGFASIVMLALGLAAFILSHSKPKPDRSTRVITTASLIILGVIALFGLVILLKVALD